MKWSRRGGEKRGKYYISDDGTYVLRWYGSTHGVWNVEHKGKDVRVCALLSDAKREAETHRTLSVKDKRLVLDPRLLDDTRRLLGKGKYNSPANICWNDNYFAKSLTDRWGEAACAAARRQVEQEEEKR